MHIINRVKIGRVAENVESDGSESEFDDPGKLSEFILPHFSSS